METGAYYILITIISVSGKIHCLDESVCHQVEKEEDICVLPPQVVREEMGLATMLLKFARL